MDFALIFVLGGKCDSNLNCVACLDDSTPVGGDCKKIDCEISGCKKKRFYFFNQNFYF